MPQPASHSDLPFAAWRRFAWRDGVLVLSTVLLWCFVLTQTAPRWVEISCGLLTGLCALQFHEWGHLIGGLKSRAELYPPRRLMSPFLFGIDATRTTHAQFLSLTWPAFAATAIYITLFAVFAPQEHLAGRITLGMGAITASLTLIIEVPIAMFVLHTKKVPNTALFKPSN